jgi:hypothetical protein
MPADLYPVYAGPIVVGTVDDSRGQPQDALLDLLEGVEFGRRETRHDFQLGHKRRVSR